MCSFVIWPMRMPAEMVFAKWVEVRSWQRHGNDQAFICSEHIRQKLRLPKFRRPDEKLN